MDRELFDQAALLVLHWGILLEIGDGYARFSRRGKANDLFHRILSEERYLVVPLTQDLLDAAFAKYLARSDKEWGLTEWHCRLSFRSLIAHNGRTHARVACAEGGAMARIGGRVEVLSWR